MTSDQTTPNDQADAAVRENAASERPDAAGKRVTIRMRDSWPIWSGSQMVIRRDADAAAK